jgi:hypothetical protein
MSAAAGEEPVVVVVVVRPAPFNVAFEAFCDGGKAAWLVVDVAALFTLDADPPKGLERGEPFKPNMKPDEAVTITSPRTRPATSPAPKRFPSMSLHVPREGR